MLLAFQLSPVQHIDAAPWYTDGSKVEVCEAVYDVGTEIDDCVHTFEVLVATGKIGNDLVPYATFSDPEELRIFAHDHRPITDILRRVTAIHNHEPVVLPASMAAQRQVGEPA